MSAPQVQIDYGYPEFVPRVFLKHERFFAAIQKIEPLMNDLFSKAHSEPLHKVCRYLTKIVANSVNAVLLLGLNGFGNDSLKIVRSMFEAAVTVAYLRNHPGELDDYLDFHFLVAKKRLTYMEKYAPMALAQMSPQAVSDANAGFAKVRPRYVDKKNRVRARWSKKPFSAICAELGLEQLYLAFYDLTSHIIHADISGAISQGDREPGVLDVEIAPSELHIEMALRSAHCYLVIAVTEYVALARPEKQGIAAQIERDFVDVWKN